MKKYITKTLEFITGLGFYGIGLFLISMAFYFLLEGSFWTNMGSGFLGAFIFKNFASIVDYLKQLWRIIRG